MARLLWIHFEFKAVICFLDPEGNCRLVMCVLEVAVEPVRDGLQIVRRGKKASSSPPNSSAGQNSQSGVYLVSSTGICAPEGVTNNSRLKKFVPLLRWFDVPHLTFNMLPLDESLFR